MRRSDPHSGPPSWGVYTALVMRGAAIVLCLSAPFTHVSLIIWLAVLCMAVALFLQWGGWMLARVGAAKAPVFGSSAARPDDTPLLSSVALIAPARNEEAAIERAVRSMAAQDYPSLQVIVVDDHSTDATPQILDRLAVELPRLRVLHAPPLEPGWTGKQSALWAAVHESEAECDWLLFTDADIVFGPTVLRDAVIYAEKNGVDFLTCIPWVETNSVLEELLLGAQWAAHFQLAFPQRLNHPTARAVGIGGFMLVRRPLYLKSNGHAAIANIPSEDVALAALVKKAGGKMGFGRAGHELRCRQYNSLSEALRAQVRKQRTLQKDRIASFLSSVEYHFLVWVLPLPLAVTGIASQTLRGSFSWGLTAFSVVTLATYLQGVLSLSLARLICRMRPLARCLGPILGLMRMYISLSAIWGILRHKPLAWRGRDLGAAGPARSEPRS